MKRKNVKSLILFLTITTALCMPSAIWSQTRQQTTVRQQMEKLHNEQKLNFVYDSSINVDMAYKGPPLDNMPQDKALKTLFDGTGIEYKRNGKYVLLSKKEKSDSPKRTHTMSGYIQDSSGESLINATIYDLTTGTGTMSNEYGFYSLTLPEGNHQLRISYIGYINKVESVNLRHDLHTNFKLEGNTQLSEVVVEGDLNSPLLTTQTGKRSLTQQDIKTEFSLLSSPDVVKTLQRLSGVQEGVELASGLYVHGGNNDENLFLIDGTPLYQTNHSLGLFSSFNADVVKNVDFYKSGFPARYGGRLSSVVDVRTNDGNWKKLHGSYRIGLLDGSVQLDGPIKLKSDAERIKNGEVRGVDFGTAFNVGLRRSWLDLISRPAFAIVNHFNDEEKISLAYDFHDLNLRLTHILNRRSQLSLSLYSGNDALTSKDDWRDFNNGKIAFRDKYENKFRWGNINAALAWRLQLSPKLLANFNAVYTHNRANLWSMEDDHSYGSEGQQTDFTYSEHIYRSTIYDAGYRTEFYFRPNLRHHVRFGHDYTMHLFRPQTRSQLCYWDTSNKTDTLRNRSNNRHSAHEMTLYAEDEITLSPRWSLNSGLHASLFVISGKTFANIDPRLAVKYQLAHDVSLKASFTTMAQYVHKITNSFLELPTDYWVPTTSRLHPMRSYQLAAGAYWQPQRQWTLSVEGYYKRTHHLLQYSSWAGLEPPAASWDTQVYDGDGRFYGMEVDAQYRSQRLTVDAAYTLSWNERRFAGFYDGWYYDKFDNRHKLNISLRYNFGPKTQMYAAWTYHTGNHMTFPTQYIHMPNVPTGAPAVMPTGSFRYRSDFYFYDIHRDNGGFTNEFIYEQPNNITLPAYHRLDLGFNFHHTTKHGHERIWNISLYNAYCHLNPLWVEIKSERELPANKVDLSGHQNFKVKTRGFIPVIPSFSYTIKF